MSVIKVEAKIILLSCDYDGVVALWSIDSILENISYAQFSLIKTWKASEKEILTSSSQWVLHEPIYATGGNDNIIHLWHEVNGNYIDEPLKGHNDSITAIVFDGLFLISGSEDLTIRIWDIVNKVQLLVITNLHTKAIRSISLFHNESKFASCDASGVIAIYDYIKKKEIWKVKHLSDCRCIWVDPDNPKRMYACIKFELVPHDIPDESPKGLPPLVGIRSGNIPTIRKTV
ncbi:WD40 repeat-like protein [Histomonas meleagridis]|uniref:WD40 repeat-like protein n=1 Tax=Histomonas meleagridis TaxID=135588 RepID=UPI003559C394|nr:WD40 repeat-like protein [Histomonas meleagridis]KAH0797785.1 WD40 repeat-like protein [Histomonas meleagridis]